VVKSRPVAVPTAEPKAEEPDAAPADPVKKAPRRKTAKKAASADAAESEPKPKRTRKKAAKKASPTSDA
jgi:hypothetical protein